MFVIQILTRPRIQRQIPQNNAKTQIRIAEQTPDVSTYPEVSTAHAWSGTRYRMTGTSTSQILDAVRLYFHFYFLKESLLSSKIIPVLFKGVCSNKALFSKNTDNSKRTVFILTVL